MSALLPDPSLTQVYRLEATVGEPLDLGDIAQGRRRGEDVDAAQYTFRTSTKIETAAAGLKWLNKGVFISVGARQRGGVIYETYLVG